MKLSKFANLVKAGGRCAVLHVAGSGIWLSTGTAIYRATELPDMEGSEQVRTVLDMTADAWKKVYLTEDWPESVSNVLGLNLAPYAQGEQDTEKLKVAAAPNGLWCSACRCKVDGELIFYNEAYLAPLAEEIKKSETEASGIGWELFLNYRIARDKYHPDYFLYENNKSMSPAIRAQITAELGVEPVLINSALVSAQNRQRLYWVGKREPDGTYSQVRVEQPEDRGILLRGILESGVCWREKGYALTASNHSATAEDMIARRQRNGAAEPIRIGTIENDAKKQDFDSQQYRVYSPDGKSVTLCGNGGGVGAKTGLYAVPVPVNETVEGKAQCLRATYYKDGIRNMVGNTVDRKTCVAMPVGMAAGPKSILVVTDAGKSVPVYEVRNGKIAIKGKEYPIKLTDGFYIIRKLTVTECKRLQTVPDTYTFPVSDTQAYKMLSNDGAAYCKNNDRDSTCYLKGRDGMTACELCALDWLREEAEE